MQLDAFGKKAKFKIEITESAIIERFRENGLNRKVKVLKLLISATAVRSTNTTMLIM